MQNSNELLHQAFAVFIFCTAVTVLFIAYKNYTAGLYTSQKIIKEDIMYEQYNEIQDKTYSKGEIISLFLTTLDYDLEIDGQLISKNENLKDNISTYNIVNKNFKKTYAYDSNGNITRVIFTSIN